MIIRVTQKLAKKIKAVPAASLPPHDNPLLDWSAHLFMVSRWQCVIVTNSICLYSIVFSGKGIFSVTTFLDRSFQTLDEYMSLDGVSRLFNDYISPAKSDIQICKAADRRVLGSINDAIFQAKCDMLEIGYPLAMVNKRLNDTPRSMIRYRTPKSELLIIGAESQT